MTAVRAPAKLTTSLAVTGVRPDGYHELRAEMVSIDLADTLDIDAGGSGLRIDAGPGTRAEALAGADESNLVTRALAAAGMRAAVTIHKRIPLGGGLGGGSSDAAAVLRWAACTDLDVALGLGADVPFCLCGGRALVEGIGERVTPLPFEDRRYVLLVPPFGVDTPRVYAAWDALAPARRQGGGGNDLTAAALAVEPRLAVWRDALGELTGCTPALAGSGSTWFVEGWPADVGAEGRAHLSRAGETALMVRVRTVPAGWEGD
ncbi:MAG TPA: 4-(cytidine 5'-diphospho)-2-C-methyl-D-erythritol kinase [Acidimicrobiales bacterium]|nr:4-(cytidine 5'-diphospho)-2-C-methyl-D-erythritol kinase [Acidimicrobiales bacterium]